MFALICNRLRCLFCPQAAYEDGAQRSKAESKLARQAKHDMQGDVAPLGDAAPVGEVARVVGQFGQHAAAQDIMQHEPGLAAPGPLSLAHTLAKDEELPPYPLAEAVVTSKLHASGGVRQTAKEFTAHISQLPDIQAGFPDKVLYPTRCRGVCINNTPLATTHFYGIVLKALDRIGSLCGFGAKGVATDMLLAVEIYHVGDAPVRTVVSGDATQDDKHMNE
jgi:hypothetical protein